MNIADWQIDVLRRVVNGENWCPHEHTIEKKTDEDGCLVVWITCAGESEVLESVRFPTAEADSEDIRLFMKTTMGRHQREAIRGVLAVILDELEDQNTTDKWLAKIEARLSAVEERIASAEALVSDLARWARWANQ